MARLTLTAGESVGLSSGNYSIFGSTAGAETVTIAAGTTVTLDASFNRGGDIISLGGNAANYTAARSGSSIVLTDTSGGSITIPVGTITSTVKFADVAAGRTLVFNTNTNAVELGAQTVTTTAAGVTAGSGGGTAAADQTFILTTGINSGASFTGGTGNDTFDGSTSNSLNTGDVLAGGAGTDTLSATLNGTTSAPNVSGVEVLNLTAGGSNATVSAANVSGVTTVNNVGSTGNLTLTNVGTVPTTLGLNTNSNTTTLTFTSAALAGTDDVLTVNLDGASGNATVALDLVSGATGELETVSLVSGSVANVLKTLDSENAGVATVTISGDQAFTLTDAFGDTVTTISAGSATGALTFSTGADDTTVTTGSGNDAVTSGAGNDTISLGAGNDTITSGAGRDNISGDAGADRIQFDGANFDGNDTVAGGADTDTIVLTANATYTDTDFRNVSTVEVITTTGNTGLVVDFNANADAAGVSTITGAGSGNDNITIGSAFDNALRVNIGTGNDTVTAAATSNASVTVSAAASAIDANDAFTGGNLTGDVIRLSAGGTATFGGSVTKFETVQVVAGSTADNDIVIAMNDAMILGSNSISVDASGLSNSNATLTLTSGESNTNATVNVTGGAGADTITGASEKSNFSGGAGNDVFRFDSSVLDANDTVSGGDGTDTIRLTNDTGSYVDTDFVNISGVERVSVDAGTGNWSATFNGNADASGFSTVTGATTSNENITLGSAFDNALRIDLGGGDDTVRGASSNAAVTVSANAGNITTADSLVGGGTTGDVIRITMGAGGETATFGNVSGFETITIVGSGDNDVLISMNDTMIGANGSLTVDATDLSNSNATLTLSSAETTTTATLTVLGGAGADTIVGASEKANFSGGAGNDAFVFDAAVLTSADTLSGGDGTDSIAISANHANGVTDADFSNVTGIENLTVSASGNQVVATFNANADASAISTVTGQGTANDVITVGSAFDNALVINLAAGDNDKVDASASSAAITVSVSEANLAAGDTLIGGTGAGDVIRITAEAGSAVFGSSVSGFETITVVGDNDTDVSVTTSDAMTNRAVTLTVDATSMSNSNADLTFVSGEATDELVTINVTGGAGADVMTGGLEQSNFSGGSGADTFIFTATNLNAFDTISGGANTDTLTVVGTVVDSDFTNVTGVEVLTSSANVVATLGASADASGLATITGGANDDSVTIGAGFDNALRVTIGAGNDVVNATGSAAVVTIAATGAVDANDTLIGGSTSGDVISLTAGVSATFGGNVSKFETVSVAFASGGNTTSVVIHDNMTAAGTTLTVTAAGENAANDVFNFNGTAELDGSFSITGSAGDDSISGGLQADTISGGNGADIILGGAGVDVLTGGLGADTITGGAGADAITLTETTAANDVVKFTSNLFTEAGDTITGFNSNTGGDIIEFSNAAVTNGGSNATLNTTDVNGTVGANDVFIEITTTLSDLTSATSVASSLSGVTVSNVTSGETVIFALQDGTDTYLWAFTQDGRSGIQASSDLTFVAKLAGVTDIANGDLALGA